MNHIIDNNPLETLIEDLDYFIKKTQFHILNHSVMSIHHKYTNNILKEFNPKNKIIIALYCFDTTFDGFIKHSNHSEICPKNFDIFNCPSVLIYKKCKLENEIHYYILFTCTARRFRGQGYASKLFNGFLERIRTENKDKTHEIKVILSSLESSVLFYESYGFKWTRKCISEYPVLISYEEYEKDKEYFMMELVLTDRV